MKINALKISLLVCMLSISPFCQASNATESLGTCMSDSLNGKERKQLATWIFFALAAHPDIKTFSNITPEAKITIDKETAKLFTRLITEDCVAQLQLAYKDGGTKSMESAFEVVGRVAMQEIVTNADVSGAITDYAKYLDPKKIDSVFKQP